MKDKNWCYYMPNDIGPDERPSDHMRALHAYLNNVASARVIAEIAVEDDYNEHGGNERPLHTEFTVVVSSPDGTEHRFIGENCVEVNHTVREDNTNESR